MTRPNTTPAQRFRQKLARERRIALKEGRELDAFVFASRIATINAQIEAGNRAQSE